LVDYYWKIGWGSLFSDGFQDLSEFGIDRREGLCGCVRIVNVSSGLGSVGWHEFKSEFGGAGLGKDGQADFKAQFFIDCGSD